VCLFLVLGFHAMSAVAQTASASLQSAADSPTPGNGTAKLEDRIEAAAAMRTPSELPETPSASLTRVAVNLALADDSELPFGTSRKLHYGPFVDGDTPLYPSTDLPRAEDARASSNLAVQPVEPPHPDTRIRWKSANEQALLSTGIMHIFNIWTEAGTRDALNGPWLRDYLHSVGELRGWSDSDEFMSPYLGHSIQGSSFSFILRQNDPKYRDVQ